ncbi:MAG: hypothetical protein WCC86_05110 [Methanoregula sp.]|uniref:hypothetical protein n=1 Tax=Methanoregula sp. TaxID=2052170 RepID=UPI003BAE273F
MRIKIIPFFTLFVLGLILVCTGCLGTKSLTPTATSPPSILVDYHRTGGVSNVNDRLIIFDNGVSVISTVSSNAEITLNATDLSLISVLLNESQFSELQTNYPAANQGENIMTYTISYQGKTVRAQETDVPPSLESIIGEMNHIITSANATKPIYPTLGIAR